MSGQVGSATATQVRDAGHTADAGPRDGGRAIGAVTRRRPARRGEGDRLRAEIIDAALRMLAETGETATLSLRAVARQVGVTATSIYLHFPDLTALIVAAKETMFDRLEAALAGAADLTGADPIARIKANAHAYVAFGMANPGHYRVLFSSPAVTSATAPQVGFIGASAFDRVVTDIAVALRVTIGDDRDAVLVGVHFWTALHGMVTLRDARPGFPWPDLETELDDLVDRLVRVQRPGARPPRDTNREREGTEPRR
jgi:AcrR family transcriptional regulator